MRKYSIRDIQLAQLELAKEFKRVCEENKLKYFMDSGTLLGAVRHGGFIPWDDDMDFGMLRDEYEKLLEIAPTAFRNKYFLQTWDNDPYYPYGFAKLRKIGTKYVETALVDNMAHNELYIDIFPYDSYPDGKRDQIKQGKKIEWLKYTYMMKQNVKPWRNHDNKLERILVFLKYFPSKICAFFSDKNSIKESFKREMIRFNDTKTLSLYEQTGGTPYGKWVMSREYFTELDILKFEDTFFWAPKLYNEYLKSAYGNYMELPPENKRSDKHKIIEVEL